MAAIDTTPTAVPGAASADSRQTVIIAICATVAGVFVLFILATFALYLYESRKRRVIENFEYAFSVHDLCHLMYLVSMKRED